MYMTAALTQLLQTLWAFAFQLLHFFILFINLERTFKSLVFYDLQSVFLQS